MRRSGKLSIDINSNVSYRARKNGQNFIRSRRVREIMLEWMLRMIGGRNEIHHQLAQGFPAGLTADVERVISIMPRTQYDPNFDVGRSVTVNHEQLLIPYRIYAPEPDVTDLNQLTDLQKCILASLYTRHHNGHIRERHLKYLIESPHAFVVPYVLQLLGEYVLEIILILESRLTRLCEEPYLVFLRENESFFQLTQSRVISYWDCYYRQTYPSLDDYPGYRVVRELGRSAFGYWPLNCVHIK